MELLKKLMQTAAKVYQNNLFKNQDVLNYLVYERGISLESVEKFGLGFCKKDEFFKSINSPDLFSLAKEKCLIWDGFNCDYFAGYIIFPLVVDGEIVNLFGRAFDADKNPHLVLPKTDKSIPYNFDALKKDTVIVTESPIDTITLDQNGFNSVATFGSNFSTRTVPFFKNKTVYILYDKDSAGKSGAIKAAQKLNGVSKATHILEFPNKGKGKEDVNSYFSRVKYAKESIQFLCKNSLPIPEREFGSKKINKKNYIKLNESEIDIIVLGKQLFPDYIDRGDSIWIRCPHHNQGTEKKASLCIGGPRGNIFYCFGCQVGGGPIRLVQWHLFSDQPAVSGRHSAIAWLREQNYSLPAI